MSNIHTIFDKPNLNNRTIKDLINKTSIKEKKKQISKKKFSFSRSKGHVLGQPSSNPSSNLLSLSSSTSSSSLSSSNHDSNPWAHSFRQLNSQSSSNNSKDYSTSPIDQLNNLLTSTSTHSPNRLTSDIHRNPITGSLVRDLDSALPESILRNSASKGAKKRGGKMTGKSLIQSINKVGQETASDREIAEKIKQKRQKDLPMTARVREWSYVQAQTIHVKIECRECGKKITLTQLKKWWNESAKGQEKNSIDQLTSTNLPPRTFEVESIRCKKKVGQSMLFLVKWKGYQESENTWEPKDNLVIGFKDDELDTLPYEDDYNQIMEANISDDEKMVEREMENKYREDDNQGKEKNKRKIISNNTNSDHQTDNESTKRPTKKRKSNENSSINIKNIDRSNSEFRCPSCNGTTTVNLILNPLYIDGNTYKEETHYSKGKELLELLENYRQFHLEDSFHVSRLCCSEDENGITILWSLMKDYGHVSEGLKKYYGDGGLLYGKGKWKNFDLYEDGKTTRME